MNKLQERLDAQTTPPERSAALVVGAGGLPYLLGKLNTPRIFDIDLSDDVLALTAWRIGRLGRHWGWDAYHDSVDQFVRANNIPQHYSYQDERERAVSSGLQGDYHLTQARGRSTEFTFVKGDIRVMAPHIGRLAAQTDSEFTFVNFTNLANYIGADRSALHRVLDILPVAPDATIVDSSPGLLARPYSLEEYRAL